MARKVASVAHEEQGRRVVGLVETAVDHQQTVQATGLRDTQKVGHHHRQRAVVAIGHRDLAILDSSVRQCPCVGVGPFAPLVRVCFLPRVEPCAEVRAARHRTLQRFDHEGVGGIDWDASAKPLLGSDRTPRLARAVGVVRVAIAGRGCRTGKLSCCRGHEINRIGLRPRRDRDRGHIGRRKDCRDGYCQDADAGESKHQLFDQVVRDHPHAPVVLLLRCAHGFHGCTTPSGSIGLTTPRARTMTMCSTTRNVTPIGRSMMWSPYI